MPDWERTETGGFALCRAAHFISLSGVVQGFTTRHGGGSEPPYATLNLGAHVEDRTADVEANRHGLWNMLGFDKDSVALAEQVHGRKVVCVSKGGSPVPGADALITDTPNLLLMLFFADCVPVYLVDPASRAMGLVHAGWRGTVAGIVSETVGAMQERFGSQPKMCRAAIGPCIGGANYEVGRDVADQFQALPSAQTVNALVPRDVVKGTFSLDLRRIIFGQLLSAGLSAENIAVSNDDTFGHARDFFSYRRDGRKTGRMAAYMAWR